MLINNIKFGIRLNVPIVLTVYAFLNLFMTFIWRILKQDSEDVFTFQNESYFALPIDPSRGFDFMHLILNTFYNLCSQNIWIFSLLNFFFGCITLILINDIFIRLNLQYKIRMLLLFAYSLNPLFIYFNNFLLKESFLHFCIVFFLTLTLIAKNNYLTNLAALFFLYFIFKIREPFIFLGILLLPNKLSLKKFAQLGAVALIFIIMIYSNTVISQIKSFFFEKTLGTKGSAKLIFLNLGIQPDTWWNFITNKTGLLIAYLYNNFIYFITPGIDGSIALNFFASFYDSILYLYFIYSFKWSNKLNNTDNQLLFKFCSILILISTIFIIFDANVRYRLSLIPILFIAMSINISGKYAKRSMQL